MTPKEKALALARKLHALRQRGVGGEAENAKAALENLMRKAGISPDELGMDETKPRAWRYRDKGHKDFIVQVIASVAGRGQCYHYSGERNKVYADLTNLEFAEVTVKIDHYWRLYQEEVSVFYEAFIQANKLFAKLDKDQKGTEPKQLTREEIERMKEIWKKMGTIRTDSPQRRLQ